MAKPILFLLALSLVATGTGGALAAGRDSDDLPQRQEAMAEAVRAMSSYDPAHHAAETAQRAMRVVNGELALLRPVFNAVAKMPEGTAEELRVKEDARAAAKELLASHLRQLLPAGTVKMEEL